ncbi:hypothetical protein SELMODRAFT_416355 [Selaginella moellendorffii]|uniref:Uncharacterized protein n=2 Tax=Selaginella moellendorffii TaxID=88036 RepID=D8RZ12_SELML|nr:hypothetical protein SELMODRAFT_416355 [Selaginella moellendorffii]
MARALKEKLLPKNQRQKSKASPPEDRYFTFTPDDARGTWAAAPRRSTLSKLRDSFRLFEKTKSGLNRKLAQDGTDLVKDRSKTGLDPPRFSCDGISEFKLKEPPRRSLDGRILLGTSDPPDDPPSYEPPRRSFDVGMLSKTYQNSQQQQQQQQRTNVVARLMGLSDTHLDGPCRKLEDFFKDELASKGEKTNVSVTTVQAESNVPVLGPGVKTDSSPERSQQQQQQQQKSQNFPKAKQDVISTMQQQASFQKVVERLERLQISESLKQQQHCRAHDSDINPQQHPVEERTPGDSNLGGQKSLFEELLKLEELRARPGAKQLSKKSKPGPHHHHQKISQSTDSQARISILVLKTTQAPRHSSSIMQVGATSTGSKRPKQSFTTNREKKVPSAADCRGGSARSTQATKTPANHRNANQEDAKIFLPTIPATEKRIHTVSRSSLMRPTIASSARGQRHQRHRIVGAAPGTPKPSETPAKNKKISNEWSPRRDQSESRAALLTLRERKKREVAAAAAVSSRVDSDGGDLGNVTISQESCEKSFRQYDPGTETSTAAAPGSDLRSSTKPSVDAFENWSPVSVLERPVSYEDEDEDLHHCDVAAAVKPSPDQQVRNVEPDKFRDASKISQPDKPAMIRKQPLPELPSLGVFKAPFFSAFDDEHDSSMHVCVDHWSHHHHRHHRQQCCAKCLAQVCIQVDTAIFDDLVYDSIIQLNAQHITKWMRMSMLS